MPGLTGNRAPYHARPDWVSTSLIWASPQMRSLAQFASYWIGTGLVPFNW